MTRGAIRCGRNSRWFSRRDTSERDATGVMATRRIVCARGNRIRRRLIPIMGVGVNVRILISAGIRMGSRVNRRGISVVEKLVCS